MEMQAPSGLSPQDFALFTKTLVGLPVSRVWQGYGAAIFLEFGKLHSTRKRDGQPGSPRGDWSLFIEWSCASKESAASGAGVGVTESGGLGPSHVFKTEQSRRSASSEDFTKFISR
ncbi:MAG: hypothetical protein M3Y50_03420 [Acidobacteriota bacterium]|nr:hypothetical protein [Acidobacteriota bacterium]